MPTYSMIYAAAGASSRFGGKVKKPYALMDERPGFMRSVEAFINREECIQHILLVSPEDEAMVKEKFAANIMLLGLRVVCGGSARHESVANALAVVDEKAEIGRAHV